MDDGAIRICQSCGRNADGGEMVDTGQAQEIYLCRRCVDRFKRKQWAETWYFIIIAIVMTILWLIYEYAM